MAKIELVKHKTPLHDYLCGFQIEYGMKKLHYASTHQLPWYYQSQRIPHTVFGQVMYAPLNNVKHSTHFRDWFHYSVPVNIAKHSTHSKDWFHFSVLVKFFWKSVYLCSTQFYLASLTNNRPDTKTQPTQWISSDSFLPATVDGNSTKKQLLFQLQLTHPTRYILISPQRGNAPSNNNLIIWPLPNNINWH